MNTFKSALEVAAAIPESARCVLLGECTHGTEEFYNYRAEITKYLIDTRGFQLVHNSSPTSVDPALQIKP